MRQLGAITRTCNEPARASPVRDLFQCGCLPTRTLACNPPNESPIAIKPETAQACQRFGCGFALQSLFDAPISRLSRLPERHNARHLCCRQIVVIAPIDVRLLGLVKDRIAGGATKVIPRPLHEGFHTRSHRVSIGRGRLTRRQRRLRPPVHGDARRPRPLPHFARSWP